MFPSYSLHTRIHRPKANLVKKRKRRPVHLFSDNYRAHKYVCHACRADVYFLPGHELMCPACASRIVEKVAEVGQKRVVSAR
jgi:DNA-directed RNA polymerase subunit RPC12/RpoP